MIELAGPLADYFKVNSLANDQWELEQIAPFPAGSMDLGYSLIETIDGFDNSPRSTVGVFKIVGEDAPADTAAFSTVVERTAVFPKVQLGTLVSDVIPRGSTIWKQVYDPADHVPFFADFSSILDTNEKIADIERIRLTASATALGLSVDLTPLYRPVIDAATGQKIRLWFTTDEATQEEAAFDKDGVQVGVTVRILTDSNPPKRFERTSVLTVRQQ